VSIVTNTKELFEEQRWKGKCGGRIQKYATFSYQGSLMSLEAPWHWSVVTIAGSYEESNSL
jgi:hypothetical protein